MAHLNYTVVCWVVILEQRWKNGVGTWKNRMERKRIARGGVRKEKIRKREGKGSERERRGGGRRKKESIRKGGGKREERRMR